MAKKIDTSFNFGANVKPKKAKKSATGRKSSGGRKTNPWTSYTSGK